uniref:Trehalase n=1 Tax=Heterorhabditis bacteriophora TaxID=37862 RepID=A0A1I7W6A1_HETBA
MQFLIEEYHSSNHTIINVLWNESFGCWFDFDLRFDSLSIAEYLKKSGVLTFPGGLPSSLVSTVLFYLFIINYNVESSCYKINGGGGEYEVQEGFGWTNGVLLDLLVTYKEQLAWVAGDECECCNTEQCIIQVA